MEARGCLLYLRHKQTASQDVGSSNPLILLLNNGCPTTYDATAAHEGYGKVTKAWNCTRCWHVGMLGKGPHASDSAVAIHAPEVMIHC
jgi:hypothetical protein